MNASLLDEPNVHSVLVAVIKESHLSASNVTIIDISHMGRLTVATVLRTVCLMGNDFVTNCYNLKVKNLLRSH